MNDLLTYAIKAGPLKLSCTILLVMITGMGAISAHRGTGSKERFKPQNYSAHSLKTANIICGVIMQDSVVGYTKSSTNNQIFYLLTVQNTGTLRDSFNFSYTATSTPLYTYIETVSGTTITRTPGIEPGASYSFIIRFVVPNGSPAQTTNYTNLVATSSICGSSSTDTTHLLTHLYSGKATTGDSCDVQVSKTADVGTIIAGSTITYTISIINNLPGLAKDVFAIDTLASSLVYQSSAITVVPSGYSYSLTYDATSRTVQFRSLTSLGQSQPITFTVKVKAACTAVPSVVNKAIVTSSTYDNNSSNDASSVTTNVNTSYAAPTAPAVTSCYNSSALLTASGAGSGTGYKWYSVSSGGSYLSTGSNYTTPVLNSSTSYYVAYYNVDTAACEGPRTAVAVTVKAAPVVSGPSSVTVCPNDAASFTESATGTSLTYQWQVSTNGGVSWSSLSNSSPYSGVSTATLGISSATYAMNGYQYRCNVASGGCTNTISSASATLTVRKSYTWLGVNTNWDDPVNWCSGVPDSSSDVTIPSGLSYYPIITGTASTHDIYTGSGTTVTLDSGTIRIFGTVTNNGLYDARTGTIMMKGTAAQTIAGSMFNSKTILNLVDGNTSSPGLLVSSTSADTLKISGTLSFGTDSSKLNTGDNIDLLSTATATANVGIVSTKNIITGQVIVDRYINTGTHGTQHAASWLFLSTPTIGQSLKESWMENGNSSQGYGTIITSPFGTAKSFDSYSPYPAIKYFDASKSNWVGMADANNSLYNPYGYMVYIGGDRTVKSFYSMSNCTILRSKGNLITGNTNPITVVPDHYQSVGNPYASKIDFTLISKDAMVDDKYYEWDPYVNGTYGYGGYETVSSTNDWKPLPGGTTPYASGVANSTIQSGQAFFVYSTATASFVQQNANLYFTENCKTDGNKAVNFTRNSAKKSNLEKSFLRASLFTGTSSDASIADGNAVAFSTHFSNKVDRDDALKILNGGENFGFLQDGKYLVIDARQPPKTSDTLFYFISNVRQQTYQIRFAPENWQDFSLQPVFYDSYLNIRTPLSITDSTFIDVSFNPDPASRAIGRFMLIFRQVSALPLSFIALNSNKTSTGVLLNWKTGSEDGLTNYEVEYSTDAIHFQTVTTIPVDPQKNGDYFFTVSLPKPGNNFYRIQSKSLTGEILFSSVQKIFVPEGARSIIVAPNPLSNGLLRLCFSNEPAGVYLLRIVNMRGQTVYSGSIHFAGGSGFIEIADKRLTRGTYHAELLRPDEKKQILNVIY